MRFEWDEAKSLGNQKKHGVTFVEARSVFYEETAHVFDDPDHSEEEQRYLLVGPSVLGRVLVVVHCWREDDELIRIVSARKATRREGEAFRTKGGRR